MSWGQNISGSITATGGISIVSKSKELKKHNMTFNDWKEKKRRELIACSIITKRTETQCQAWLRKLAQQRQC